jgi:hypothetical protein
MSPTTELKRAAIYTGLLDQKHAGIAHASKIIAMLTSADKNEREQAKTEVRKLAQIGNQALNAERVAIAATNNANRFEP